MADAMDMFFGGGEEERDEDFRAEAAAYERAGSCSTCGEQPQTVWLDSAGYYKARCSNRHIWEVN